MDQFAVLWHSMQPSWTWGTKSNEEKKEELRLSAKQEITENLDREGLEQASLDKTIPSSNVGYRLLQKMGWREGQGLGRKRQGIVDPIRSNMNEFRLGLGKQEQDDFYTSEENIQRKKLEVEVEETEEMAQKREAEAQRLEKIQTEVKEIHKVFFCDLCNKQYKLASEFEVHLSSYDHNHKKRFKESVKSLSEREKEERQRREKLREQREMQRMAQLLSAKKSADSQAQGDVPAPPAAPAAASAASAPAAAAPPPSAVPPQRTSALKFGFGAKGKSGAASKVTLGKGKSKASSMAPIFGNDDEEDAQDS